MKILNVMIELEDVEAMINKYLSENGLEARSIKVVLQGSDDAMPLADLVSHLIVDTAK